MAGPALILRSEVAETFRQIERLFMKRTGKCPKCGSTEILADAKAIDRGDGNWQADFTVATFGKPEALIFKEKHTGTVSAWVCAQCGFTEFYADSPGSLRSPTP